MGCITGSWFTLKINGSHHGFFKGKSGVRQGDPLSPFLFVLSMEILSRKLRVMCNQPNVCYHPKCSKLGLTHLVFADDLMIFIRGDLPSVQQAVDTLKIFSEWSGLKANMDKTEAYLGGVDQNLRSLILSTVGFQEGKFPFRYLGLPINSSRLTRNMYDARLLKIHKVAAAYSTKFLSYAGRKTVINSTLFGLCNFWCTSFLLPRLVHKAISKMSKKNFWGQVGNERRLVYKNWLSACAPWDEGGFHIKDMEGWNKATLLKWLLCLDKNKGTIWISWIKHYITATCSIWDLTIQEQHSECLRGILHVRDICLLQMGTIPHVQHLLDSCVTQHTFSISKAYELFRKKYPIQPVFKAIHTGTMIPRHQIITMLAVQGKLAIVDQIIARGFHWVNRCYLCKEAAEDAQHLFFQCSYTKELLQELKLWVKMNTPCCDLQTLLIWPRLRTKKRHWRSKWVSCCLGSLVYSVWCERNYRIFEGRERPPHALLPEIKHATSTFLLHKINEHSYFADVAATLNS
ncbi:uncharacterized protein LOC141585820 [Silene latifolia]|uniref:uncharacterized protein LOC141585820 n=1 Tax=Silene latifolia TaxID=37657 RepID=UPI003D76B147